MNRFTTGPPTCGHINSFAQDSSSAMLSAQSCKDSVGQVFGADDRGHIARI